MKDDQKQPHERMTEKNNSLSDTQEVLYQDDFNRADAADKQQNKKDNQQNEK
ncbi:YfhE family protein [Bhargavaea massiliensis]|uniref:YfhE family protein n=1 Tax=Bhargavaea massiliensis TaxID=2697500 RepID=UPI001BCE78EB|nr:YfhE family protein [Bhargavaea massiliensis]